MPPTGAAGNGDEISNCCVFEERKDLLPSSPPPPWWGGGGEEVKDGQEFQGEEFLCPSREEEDEDEEQEGWNCVGLVFP